MRIRSLEHISPYPTAALKVIRMVGLANPLQSDRLAIVLVNTRNPLNIGAAARAMSNFGYCDLRLVQPYEPSFREARSAMGGSDVLAAAREFENVADAIADCTLVVGTTSADRRKLEHELKPLGQAAAIIRRSAKRGRVALLFGSEKRGLSNADFSHCHWLLRIPTGEEHGSMNLGQAVAVCLYEFARAAPEAMRASKLSESAKPLASELERLTSLLIQTLQFSGYRAAGNAASLAEKVRKLTHRLDPSATDTETLQGILRQILWKLKQQK